VQTACYLEDFPFPYYLAIEELHTLPEILSDALKQWFELIRGQQHSET
jgi:midasin